MANILMLHQQMMSRIIKVDDPGSTETYTLYNMPAQSCPIIEFIPTTNMTVNSYALVVDYNVGYASNKYNAIGTFNSSNQFVVVDSTGTCAISNFGTFESTTLYKCKVTLSTGINLTANTRYAFALVQDKYRNGTPKIYGTTSVGFARFGQGWAMQPTGTMSTFIAPDINYKLYLEINNNQV